MKVFSTIVVLLMLLGSGQVMSQNSRSEITDSISIVLQSANRIKASQLRHVLNIMTGSIYTMEESDAVQKEMKVAYLLKGRTLLASDAGKTLFITDSDGVTDTITIPVDVFRVNQFVNVIQNGTDEVYFKAAPGAVVKSFDNKLLINGMNAPATILYHTNDSTVTLMGNLK